MKFIVANLLVLASLQASAAWKLADCFDFEANSGPVTLGSVKLSNEVRQICMRDIGDKTDLAFMDINSRVAHLKAQRAQGRCGIEKTCLNYTTESGSTRGKSLTDTQTKGISLTFVSDSKGITLTDESSKKVYKLKAADTEFPQDRAMLGGEDVWYTLLHSENFELRCVMKSEFGLADQVTWVDLDFPSGSTKILRVGVQFPPAMVDYLEKSYATRFAGSEYIAMNVKKLNCENCYELDRGDLTYNIDQLTVTSHLILKNNTLVEQMEDEGKWLTTAQGQCEPNEVP